MGNMHFSEVELLKLFVSLIIGGVIGAEREYRSKSAGFRTIILITLGSTLFTIFSIQIGSAVSADRIASNIVTGIGFLGAGVIFREGSRVSGITTATTIWIAAALGMGVGGGYFLICIIATGLVLLVLYGFTLLERYIDSASQTRNYRIVCRYENETLIHYEDLFKQYKKHLGSLRYAILIEVQKLIAPKSVNEQSIHTSESLLIRKRTSHEHFFE